MSTNAVRTAAFFAVRHIMTVEIVRDTSPPRGSRLDAWKDGAWNIRVGRTQAIVITDPVGRGLACIARDAADWMRGTAEFLAWRYGGGYTAERASHAAGAR